MKAKETIRNILIGSGIAFWLLMLLLLLPAGIFSGLTFILGFLIIGAIPSTLFLFFIAFLVIAYFTGKKLEKKEGGVKEE